MSMGADWAYEQSTEYFCKKLVEKITKHKKSTRVVAALKELGTEIINEYIADPVIKLCIERKCAYGWVEKYQNIFK